MSVKNGSIATANKMLPVTELDNTELKETMEALQRQGKEEKWAIDFKQIKFTGEKFASGSGGDLFRVQWRGLECVAKTCPLTVGKQVLTDLANEISVLSSLRHPNLVMFLGACFEVGRPPIMLMEFCPGGNLEKKLFKLSAAGAKLKAKDAASYIEELALACNFLHNCDPPVVHRDLKPSNILLTKHNTLKVTDFGLSKFIPKRSVDKSVFTLTGETGSYRFMAPEVFKHQEYNEKVDVYSFALIVFWILSGQRPFADVVDPVDAARKAATVGKRPNVTLLPAKWRDMLQKCWSTESDARPDFNTIIAFIQANKASATNSNTCKIQ